LKESAQKGNSDAMFKLSGMTLLGERCEKNIHESIAFHKLASLKDNADALFELGKLYESEKVLKKITTKP
jgi:TPR repeat protein